MINTREHLIHVLTEAAEIEHNLLCSYLYAAFSLKRAGEPGLSPTQADAVERWRKAILSVALEEMAHLACVNNLLVAVGGAPHLQRPNLPLAPGYHPAGIVVRLTAFDPATLDHFIFLERPPTMAIPDGAGFQATGTERVVDRNQVTPSAEDYATVGELYDQIADGLRRLAARHGEAVLINRDCGQLDSELIGLPNIPRIDSLNAALTAIAHIKEEGEGSTGDDHDVDSHFDRFCAIKAEWAQLTQADPDFCPAWPAAENPVMRKPVDSANRVWIVDPEAAAHLDLANAIYGTMLSLLAHCFGGGSDDADTKALMLASVECMEASAAIGSALARMRADPNVPGVNAGMSFAAPRNLGVRPVGNARVLFLERIHELADRATLVARGTTAAKVSQRLANAIALLHDN